MRRNIVHHDAPDAELASSSSRWICSIAELFVRIP